MPKRPGRLFLLGLLGLLLAGCGGEEEVGPVTNEGGYVGSASCRSCHERFYALWAPSHHGTAMQPFTAELAAASFRAQDEAIEVGGKRYRADLDAAVLVEEGPDGTRNLPIAHVMGGKYVYYLLTPMERGRLQVLPLAFDTSTKRWYDATASMVRHAAGHSDQPVAWTDPLLTFNTSCWNCHVSQLQRGYDATTDTYRTAWAEPGINCETCHGPSADHVRVCSEAEEGQVPDDLEIVRTSTFDVEQTNDACATCHAKSVVLSHDVQPGDRFFDHFDLVALEHADFYPDGRDLGENYTFTLWRMSPCVRSGELDCVHCHTSSGRYRFAGERTNEACLPCHQTHVENAPAHTHHPAGSAGNQCVACHMPTTEFALMRRSDHSMRPPSPALTLAVESPNACNICHADEDAAWADGHVRTWRERDYQAPMLRSAELVRAARAVEAKAWPEVLAYLESGEAGEVVTASLIRLLQPFADASKLPVLVRALDHASPLVRAAAAEALGGTWQPATVGPLLRATGDEYRLVRVRAAGALVGLPPGDLPADLRVQLASATAELEAVFGLRPDEWSSHFNLGNLYERRGELERALSAYDQAIRLRGDMVAPHVNAAMVAVRLERHGQAENHLRRALEIDAKSAPANFNLGLLLAEKGELQEAARRHRAALEADPELAGAAFNLAILVADTDLEEAVDLSRRAWKLRPREPRYAWTLAFYLNKGGDPEKAVDVLSRVVAEGNANGQVYGLLGQVYEARGRAAAARAIYRKASRDPRLSPQERQEFASRAGG